VLALVEVQGIPFDTDALKIGQELTDLCQKYALRTAVAVSPVFVLSCWKPIAKASNRPIRLFKDREKATCYRVIRLACVVMALISLKSGSSQSMLSTQKRLRTRWAFSNSR
jgi:hypothetical protein